MYEYTVQQIITDIFSDKIEKGVLCLASVA